VTKATALRSVAARFGVAAPTYDEHCDIQRKVAQSLVDDVTCRERVDRVLEVGCGTGNLTRLLLDCFPDAVIHAVDIAETMIERARRRLGDHSRIVWRVADGRHLSADRVFDVIASSSALHWMVPVDETIRRLAALLGPGGRLYAALMVNGTFEELNEVRKRVTPNKLSRVVLPESQAVLSALGAAKLRVVRSREETLGSQFESAGAFLRSLHLQGVTGAVTAGPAMLNRTELREIITDYQRQYSSPSGGVFATYRVLYFQAIKDEP
jgi:malonyl-CoA O-methyltransferase